MTPKDSIGSSQRVALSYAPLFNMLVKNYNTCQNLQLVCTIIPVEKYWNFLPF